MYPSLHLNLGEAYRRLSGHARARAHLDQGRAVAALADDGLRQDDLIDHRRSGTTRRPPADAVIRFLAGWMTSQPIGEVSAGLAGTGWST